MMYILLVAVFWYNNIGIEIQQSKMMKCAVKRLLRRGLYAKYNDDGNYARMIARWNRNRKCISWYIPQEMTKLNEDANYTIERYTGCSKIIYMKLYLLYGE